MTKPPKQLNHSKVPLRGVSHLLSGSHASPRLIPLTQGKFAIVDADKYEWLMQWKWRAVKYRESYYAARWACSQGSKEFVHMHTIILGLGKGQFTDHKNHNGLDNRIRNIRPCTRSQNQHNRLPQKNCASKYKGVGRNGNGKRWLSRIYLNNKKIYIGVFDDEIEAAQAYDAKALELYGEFAYLNL